VLVCLSMLASLAAGLGQGPWWFWLLGGIALAALDLTDARKARASLVDGGASALVVANGVASLMMGCAASAGAFAAGRALWWALAP
jgi:hypothetical protein